VNYDAAKFWLDFVALLAAGGSALYTWLATRGRATDDRIDAMETALDVRLDDQERRMIRVEEVLAATPTHQDLGRIRQRIDQIGQDLSALRGSAQESTHTLRLIQEHLLNGGNNK